MGALKAAVAAQAKPVATLLLEIMVQLPVNEVQQKRDKQRSSISDGRG
jgi:hypothetical protein